jgi:hypothetical protein
LAKVNLANLIGNEEHIPETIGAGGSYGHRESLKIAADFDISPFKREPAPVLDSAHLVLGSIRHWWQLFRKWPVPDLIAARWSSHSQGLLGPLQVVDVPPVIEGLLAMFQVFESGSTQHLKGQGPMETLIFSPSLGGKAGHG